ncbi:MAG: hypothetical protein OZSIB_4096 [Candidatus Ozemobacter sibiricus]|uniref:Uncharacterized protein n=1 Tax=Candidatus Ozemobacter sibiricus TaxID=2268124 RepID=A0A367ZNB4_9BACT|nr:MAG: hypothetical protein OZSIB_4096 [Candidatus Ozemobacter sibiricus]
MEPDDGRPTGERRLKARTIRGSLLRNQEDDAIPKIRAEKGMGKLEGVPGGQVTGGFRGRPSFPYQPSRSPQPRMGMVIFTVMFVLVILGCLFFLLSRRSIQLRHVTIRILEEGLGYQRALGCATLFWRAIEDALAEQAGCALLFPPPPAPSRFSLEDAGPLSFTLDPKDMACYPELQDSLRQLCALPPAANNLEMHVLWQEKERTESTLVGEAILTITMEMRKHPMTFTFVREFRVVHMLPPVTSKHTLFVRKTRSPEMYNVLSKTFQTDSTVRKPLVLYNSDRPFISTETDAWLRSGWVYLGGTEVVLALDGTHPSRAESENFLFWPSFVFDGQGQVELPYACSPYFPGTLLRVRFTPIGAMEEWQTDRMLTFMVGADAVPLLTRSSILRLFGDRQRMTPTRVLGRVKSRYVLYSTMIYDANDDGFPEYFQPTLGQRKRAIFPIRRLVDPQDFQPPGKPRLHTVDFYDLFTPLFPRGIPQHIGRLFPAFNAGDPHDYLLFMTKLKTL